MYLRQLPSGSWRATVRLPDGNRRERTHKVKSIVRGWAQALEGDIASGNFVDPDRGKLTLSAWHERWSAARVVTEATRRNYASIWSCHLVDQWGERAIGSITRLEVQEWVSSLAKDYSPSITHKSYTLLASMMRAAEAERLIPASPCVSIQLPRERKGNLRFITKPEAARLLAELDEPYRTLVELGLHSGLRMGELTGLDVKNVDWLNKQVTVTQVMTRHEGLRDYPKTKNSRRVVPVPTHVIEAMSRLVKAESRHTGLLFTAPEGGPIHDLLFARRVWKPALERAGIEHCGAHTMRHTAASWLVQDGVDLYRVSQMLGHESLNTTMKYAHLHPGAHDDIRAAWDRMNGVR